MTGLVILVPLALLMGALGLAAFFWALKRGQFEDLDGAAARILIDEEEDSPPRGRWEQYLGRRAGLIVEEEGYDREG